MVETKSDFYSQLTFPFQVPLGLYLVRGDNIAVLGEVDEEADAQIDFGRLCADPLKPITH
jgi:U6 snRNA-associated Sm-like protein LSm8